MLAIATLLASPAGLWGESSSKAEPAAPVVRDTAALPSDGVEERTQHYLAAMEEGLREQLAAQGGSRADVWRMRFVRLSMWRPLAPLSQELLETLGDSEKARTWLFFIMPLVRWMSEPFLFPVETEGSPQEKEKQLDNVLDFISRMHARELAVSLDNVGDASLSAEDAQSYKQYYLSLIKRFVEMGQGNELYMSLKLSALTYDLDAALGETEAAATKRAEIKKSLAELLEAAAAAREKPIFIRVDMEEYAYKDLTLRLFRETVEEHASIAQGADGNLRLGVVIQAYLRDAAKDVRDLALWARSRGLRAPIRLVKGAYLRHEREVAAQEKRTSPVWGHKPSTDANYEALCAYMLLNRDAVQGVFATHNIRSMSHVMALAEVYGVEKEALEFQMLYGMGDVIKDVVLKMGYRMREYVPAGSLARGLKYAGRRFHELASSDNALARTMRGDFSAVDGAAPEFVGEQDQADGAVALRLLHETETGKQ